MSIGALPAAKPLSSGEFEIADSDRYDDVERKHQQLCDFILSHRYDAVLLQSPASFAWVTSGGLIPGTPGPDSGSALFITADARVVLTNNVDSAELFDRQLSGLGFLLKERPWHEPRQILLNDLCRGRRVASDAGWPGTADESAALSQMRLRLEPPECERLKQLGRIVAHAVEATARSVTPGQTEAEIAGQLAHRLIRHEATPIQLQVMADNRSQRYRHWTFGSHPMNSTCCISAQATRWGLSCGATRTVCFGELSDTLKTSFRAATMCAATGMYFSQAGTPFSAVWEKVQRIYEKVGHDHEWHLSDQARLQGYHPTDVPLLPGSDFQLQPSHSVFWHPSIGMTQVGDSILIQPDSVLLLTPSEDWPLLQVTIKGKTIGLPDLLRRDLPE